MSRNLKLAVLVVAIGLVAALLGFSVARLLRVSAIDAPAATTEFSLRDLAGKTHSLADWRGKVVLLNFWATWCPPCRREIPLFIELQQRYAQQGLQVVGISVDNPEAVARYWQEMHINYPLLLADESTYDLMAAYGNRQGSLPYSVLIAADGHIAGVKIGAYGRAELETALKPLFTVSKASSP
jgi:peroxiredoxin